MQQENNLSLAPLKRLVLTITGVALLAAGVLMILLPGPAIVFIPAGLALLAMEYDFARQLLGRFRRWLSRQSRAARQRQR